MSSSTRRPARRTLPTRTAKKISMSRQYTSSFSGIDWGGMLSGSLLKPRGSDFSVGLDSIDLPSMSSGGGGEGSSVKQSAKKKKSGNGSGNDDGDDDEGKSNARGSMLLVEQILQENEQEGKRNKPLWKELKDLYTPTKSKQKVQFDMNGEDDCEEVVMEDGQKIIVSKCGGCDKSRGGCRRCLVALTLLAIVAVVAATVYFVMFPPNTASFYWKKAMSGMRDWNSSSSRSNNNNVVVQQQLLQQQQQGRGQEMLELAEQITLACGESSLLRSGSVSSSASVGGDGGVDARSGMSTCQELCHNHMCCVEQDDEYSCKNDVMKDCAVYAGCVALIDDNFW